MRFVQSGLLPARSVRTITAVLFGITLLTGCTASSGDAGSSTAKAPQCPQPRFTDRAPNDYYQLSNPLPADAQTLKAGEKLFRGGDGFFGCAACHGSKGDGLGPLSSRFDPPPRNFSCDKTVREIPDGQLFWITRFGSPGTSMPAHETLRDEQVWQLVHHLRHLAASAQ